MRFLEANSDCKRDIAVTPVCPCCGAPGEEDSILVVGACEACIEAGCVGDEKDTVTCRECGEDFLDEDRVPGPGGEGEYCPKCAPRHAEDQDHGD